MGPHTVLPASLATAEQWFFRFGSRNHGVNFATIWFMPRSHIKISGTVVFGIPRSASRYFTVSHQSLLIAAHTRSTFSGVLLVAGLPECGSLSTDSQPSLKHLLGQYQVYPNTQTRHFPHTKNKRKPQTS